MTCASEQVGRETGSVLVVDDDILQRREIVRCLCDEGIATCEAGDGEEALAALRKERPVLVIMDIRMPTLDGVAAAIEMSADLARSPKIILVTGDPDSFSLAEETGLNLAAVVEKPIDLRALMSAVTGALGPSPGAPEPGWR